MKLLKIINNLCRKLLFVFAGTRYCVWSFKVALGPYLMYMYTAYNVCVVIQMWARMFENMPRLGLGASIWTSYGHHWFWYMSMFIYILILNENIVGYVCQWYSIMSVLLQTSPAGVSYRSWFCWKIKLFWPASMWL